MIKPVKKIARRTELELFNLQRIYYLIKIVIQAVPMVKESC